MCHLVLALPIVALSVFWLAPLPTAVSIYAPVLALSLWAYWFVMKALHSPVQTGREQLLRSTGEVVQATTGTLLVNVRGELWQAISEDELRANDAVKVTAVTGLKLHVRKLAASDAISD